VTPSASRRRSFYLIGAALLVIALVGGRWVAVETAERAWDRTFDGGATLIEARTLSLMLRTFVVVFAIAWTTGNLFVVYRAIGSVQMPRRLGDLEIVEAVPQRVLFAVTIALGVVLGVLFSLGTGDWWRHAVLAASPPHFGVPDETLGRDAGYYLGVLPWRAALQDRAFVLAAGALAVVALLYGLIGSLRFKRGRIRASDHARVHCGVLMACLALVIAWGAVLDPAEVIAGLHGTVDQAALAVRVPGAILVAAVAVVTAVISLAWGVRDRPNLILAGWAALILSVAACYVVIPGVVRASGNPESSLAQRRTPLERAAFGLTTLDGRQPPAFASGEVALRSIPLWDAARVGAAMSAPPNAVTLRTTLDVPSWLVAPTMTPGPLRNAIEVDTGLAVSPLPLVDSTIGFGPGVPGFLLVPPDSAPALRAAGIPIVGAWRRFAIAWTIQAWGLLRSESRDRMLVWRRDVAERLERLAPFADFGAPAPVVRNGALWWVSWGYISHEAFPLVRPLPWRDGAVRYLRAGLVGAVRVATGETHLWLAPGYDSLTAAWARHFAPLIEPAGRLPGDLRAQLQYPPGTFALAVTQLIRASADSAGTDAAWTLRPRSAFDLVTPGSELWTAVGIESGVLAPKQFVGLCAGTVTAQGPRLHFWRPAGEEWLPGELVGSNLFRPGRARIWPAGNTLITVQAQFLEPVGLNPAPAPKVAEVYVSLDRRSGRGLTARAALHGGEQVVTDTSFAARWERARRLAVQADSALGAGDLELFGRLWRALVRELAAVQRPR
jgi:hypothetical protein